MRCASYILADGIKIKKLRQENLDGLKPKKIEDGVHFSQNDTSHIFIFDYGAAVFWNLSLADEETLIAKLQEYLIKPVKKGFEAFEYTIGKAQSVVQDEITLCKTDSVEMQMLAVSYGLSQSMKLQVFEDRISQKIEETEFIPEHLARYGRIPLSRRAVSRKIGELFIERNSVNLHTDILDAPIFFWDHPEYEPLYAMTVKDLDLHSRTHVLNRRLDILRELFEVMGDHLNTRYSAMLEWIIILLILIEVILSLLIHVFKVL